MNIYIYYYIADAGLALVAGERRGVAPGLKNTKVLKLATLLRFLAKTEPEKY
jgi:hypothetical protein